MKQRTPFLTVKNMDNAKLPEISMCGDETAYLLLSTVHGVRHIT